jgi:hypothetical protein
MVQHVGDCENDKFQFVVIKIEHVMMYKKNHKSPKKSFGGKWSWHYPYKEETESKHTFTSNAVRMVANSFGKKIGQREMTILVETN